MSDEQVLQTIVSEFDKHGDAVGLGNPAPTGLTPQQTVVAASLVQAGTWMLVAHQHTRAARMALAFGCALYVGIAAWHAAFLARVLLG